MLIHSPWLDVKELGAQGPSSILFTMLSTSLSTSTGPVVRIWKQLGGDLSLQASTIRNTDSGNFPGGPVAKTLSYQCRWPGFDPWSGNSIPHAATKSQCSQVNKYIYFFKKKRNTDSVPGTAITMTNYIQVMALKEEPQT